MDQDKSLLSRLQSLTGPDREIDGEIALADGWHRSPETGLWSSWHRDGPYFESNPPAYTSSTEVALTLLDDEGEYAINATSIWPERPGRPARITMAAVHRWDGEYWREIEDERWEAEGATPAIAICIAIMRAREEGKENT